jgi:hypothetical protein
MVLKLEGLPQILMTTVQTISTWHLAKFPSNSQQLTPDNK